MVYCTLSFANIMQRQVMTGDDEWVRMWKEAVAASVVVLRGIHLEKLRKMKKMLRTARLRII
jgi:hypothetical protein